MNKIIILITTIFLLALGIWYWTSPKKAIPINANQLIVGTNAEFPPFSFINEQGEIVGFDIDIAREVGKKLNKTIVLENMSFDALIPAIQLGTIQMIAAGITPTQERGHQVLFTKPHVSCDALVIVSSANKPHNENSATSLQNKTVVVNQGYTADMFVSALQKEYPTITVIRLSSALISDGLLALQSERADVFITSQGSLQPFIATDDTSQFIISKPIINGCTVAGEAYALAIAKQYPELLLQVQAALEALQAEGTLLELQHTWGLLND